MRYLRLLSVLVLFTLVTSCSLLEQPGKLWVKNESYSTVNKVVVEQDGEVITEREGYLPPQEFWSFELMPGTYQVKASAQDDEFSLVWGPVDVRIESRRAFLLSLYE